jgi:hypothetical protein
MKIYNKVVMNMSTGETIEEDSYEYDGPIAQSAPLIIPAATALFSAAATAVIQKNFGPGDPDMPELPGQEFADPAKQPKEPGDNLKEQGILAAETKRKKQGYLQSFGGLPEETQSFGLI